MRPDSWKPFGLAALIAAALWFAGSTPRPTRADEPPPSRLGRLFRLGGGPVAPSNPSPAPRPLAPDLLGPPADVGAPPPSPPTTTTGSAPAPATGGARLVPQPRVSRPATESDPLLTRVAIGRSDNGSQFGMFLQVYADGTVLDGEGTHRVGREALRPLVEAIQATDAYRQKGHCGGAPTDFTEQVHVVVYDRVLGRLRANAFSYSGNTQGCDPGIKTLQTAIEAFQNKLSGATPAPNAPSAATAPALEPSHAAPITLTPAS